MIFVLELAESFIVVLSSSQTCHFCLYTLLYSEYLLRKCRAGGLSALLALRMDRYYVGRGKDKNLVILVHFLLVWHIMRTFETRP